ncbi:reticulocyte-binding protein 2-like isoform X2 [Aricia agestis]|uniref:reticulocyte-binding protein 2-like isoform X2 n=1 Tax=Aricia agestis TaxID=91739 RepID=UPI001C202EA0|nr:reticulocyte-binding protein 2-like isoform X2 [Aricia agestis]
MTVTNINNIIDQKTVEVGSYPFNIQAIERESPIEASEATNSNGVDQRQKPINIKIKIQNTQRKDGQNGIVAARCGSKKLRSLNSDQTIMSFDLVRENSLLASTRKHGSKFVKLLMPGKCLSSKTKDDDYSYVPSDFEINKNKCIGNLSKDNKTNLDREDDLPPIIILGKCKPGGCLDPVFSEDKLSYTPTTKTTLKISENLTRDAKTSQDKKETIADAEITVNQKESPLRTNNISSEAIITYPIAPLSGKITTTKKSNEKSPEFKNKDDKTLKNYQNELTEVFFRPSKIEGRSRETSLKENVQYLSILRTGRDIDDVLNNLTASDDQSNISSDNKNQDGNESTNTLSVTHIISENLESIAEKENVSLKSLSKITFPTHDDKNNDFIYDSKNLPNKDMKNDTKFLYEDNLKLSQSNLKDKTNEVESLSVTSTSYDNSQYLETPKLERMELPISSHYTRHSLPEILSLDVAQMNISKYIVASKNKSRDDFKKLEPSVNRDESHNILKNEDRKTNMIQESINFATDHNMKSMSETNMDDEKQKSRLSLDNIEKNIIGSKDSEKDLFSSKKTIDRINVTKHLTKSLSPSNTIICMPKQNASDERDYNNEVENKNCLSIDSKLDIIDHSKNSRATEQNIFRNSVPKYNIVQENLLSDKDLLNYTSAHVEINNTRQSSQVFEKTNFEKSEITESAPAPHNLKEKSSNDLHDILTNDINNSNNRKDDEKKSPGISMEGLEYINQKTEERNKSTDSKSTSIQKSPYITITSAVPTTQLIYDSEYSTNENQENTLKNEHLFEKKDINIRYVDLLENTITENLSNITTPIVFSTHNKENLSDDHQEKDMKIKNVNEDDEINNESLNLSNTESTFTKSMFNESVTDIKEKNSESFLRVRTPTNLLAALPQTHHSLNDLAVTPTESQITNHEKINKNIRRSLKKKPRTLDHEEGHLSIIKEVFERKTISKENMPLVATLMYDNFLENVKQEIDQNSLVSDDKILQEKYESITQEQSVDISLVKLEDTEDEHFRLTAVSNNCPSISSQRSDTFLKIAKDIRLDVNEYVSSLENKDIVDNKSSHIFDLVKTLEVTDKIKSKSYILLNLGFESYVNNNDEKIINTLDPFLKPNNNNKQLVNVIRKTARINDILTIPLDSDVEINIAIKSKKKLKIKDDEDVQKTLPTEKRNHYQLKIKDDEDVQKTLPTEKCNIQHLIHTLHDHNLVQVKNIIEQLTKDIQFINYNNLQRKIKIKSSIKSLNHKRRSLKCCKCYKRRIEKCIE